MKTLFAFLFLFGLHAGAQAIDPGQWHADTKFTVDGIPIPDSVGDQCVTASDTRDAKTTIANALTKIGCVITDWNVQGQTLNAAVDCKNSDVDASGTISGQFSAREYHLVGHAHGFYKKILPSVATVKLDGQRTGECAAQPAN